ncbi:MAG: DUF2520 domain-containing protein [Alistipes sp.]|nr:DUF2520 domain-containing protein [Candidatus Alistipes equi]
MKVTVIGSGNVAEALVKGCLKASIQLSQICSRNELRGKFLASIAKTKWFNKAIEASDVYLVAVKDSAIEEAILQANIPLDSVIAHTAGAVSIEAIPDKYKNRAVFYPFQTFTKGIDVDFETIPIFCEATNQKTLETITTLAGLLSKAVYEAGLDTRCRIHLSGVFVNNFVNHMYSISRKILQKQDLPFATLFPLMKETLRKAMANEDPDDVQTGPAVRGDLGTISRHLELLEDDENMCNIYKSITQNICKRTLKKD